MPLLRRRRGGTRRDTPALGSVMLPVQPWIDHGLSIANGVDLSAEEQTDLLRLRVRFAEEQVIAHLQNPDVRLVAQPAEVLSTWA